MEGDQLERARAFLDNARIPTVGGTPGHWTGPRPKQLDELGAIVDAESGDEAERRVSEGLPSDSDYKVGPAEPFRLAM